MATIQEVAKLAGVSVATVSRVINNNTTVSPKSREKVETAIKELNYEPNLLGRNLRCSESRLLLVIIPSIDNPFYIKIINGIEEVARNMKYSIMLCANSSPERESLYFDMLKQRLADGIILMDPRVNMERLTSLSESYPIVQCSEYIAIESIPYVRIDNEIASYNAVTHLLSLGHTDIALINTDDRFIYAKHRKQGYLRALSEYGIEVNEDWLITADNHNFEDGKKAVKKVLQLEKKPTAIFAISDTLAIGVLKQIQDSGLRVPDDIAVVGFDGISFSEMTNPALTTVSQPMYQMGVEAATMLIEKIQSIPVTSRIVKHDLVVRESTIGKKIK
ncbi:LacI family DNA-binding transcriptional regulator [Bacillus alkalicellulosilyticus]|uniref:LacI family DNA-binding transcriptional regulator n=1 Tax=Alkalihalobacterium alkalicellulosilyticum TaxID=1912214 RepID=UPI0009961C73|nr:LacI family DNA-binding transcriptional regulator [Bacillus alkalicellulosilyticus]